MPDQEAPSQPIVVPEQAPAQPAENNRLTDFYIKLKGQGGELATRFGRLFRSDIGKELEEMKDLDAARQERAQVTLDGIEKDIFKDGKREAGRGWLRGSILPIAASFGAASAGRATVERLEPLAENFDQAVNTITSSPAILHPLTGDIERQALGVELSHVSDLFENVSPPVIGAVVAASGSMAASGVRRMLGERAFSNWARYSHTDGRTILGKVGRVLGRGAERSLMGMTLGLNGFKGNEIVQQMAKWVNEKGEITVNPAELNISDKTQIKKFITEATWYTRGTKALDELGAHFTEDEKRRIAKVQPRVELVLKDLEGKLSPAEQSKILDDLRKREKARYWFQATELAAVGAAKSFLLVNAFSKASSYIGELLSNPKVAPEIAAIKTSVSNIASPLAEDITKDLQGVRDTILTEAPKVGVQINAVGENIATQTSQVGSSISESVQGVGTDITEAINAVDLPTAAEAQRAVSDFIPDVTMPEGVQAAMETITDPNMDIGEKIDSFWDTSTRIPGITVETVSAETIGGDIKDDTFWEGVYNSLPDWMKPDMAEARQTCVSLIDKEKAGQVLSQQDREEAGRYLGKIRINLSLASPE